MQILFDIDGTLIDIRSGEAEVYRAACETVLGIPVARLEWRQFTVVTDVGILRELSARHRGQPLADGELAAVRALHLEGLERLAAEGRLRALPGAAQALATCAARWPTAIATGNFRAAAWLKLRAAGLDWDGPLACAEDAETREGILQAVLRPGGRVVSIGDGSWDVSAARNLGLAFVGVAPTDASLARLLGAGALDLISDYSDLAGFLRLLETARVPL